MLFVTARDGGLNSGATESTRDEYSCFQIPSGTLGWTALTVITILLRNVRFGMFIDRNRLRRIHPA